MKDTNAVLILLGVLAAAWTGNAEAQQTYPPYSPTKNDLRTQPEPKPEDRLVRLEKKVGALEQFLALQFNGAGGIAEHAEQPVQDGTGQEAPGNPRPVNGQPDAGQYHIILEGDTLHAIARKYGVALDDVVATNNLDPYGPIYVGDRLWIPNAKPSQEPRSQPPGAQAAAAPWNASYQVRPGDTLHSIARRAGVSPYEIAQQNRLTNADQILVGQVLVLPAGQAPEARMETQSTAQAEEYYYYDVVAGDTLSSIAKTFFTAEEELRNLNALGGSALQVGQRIMVPTRLYFQNQHRKQQSPLS